MRQTEYYPGTSIKKEGAIKQMVRGIITGRISENPGDEAMGVIMKHGLNGTEYVRSAEHVHREHAGTFRPAQPHIEEPTQPHLPLEILD